MTEQEQTPVTHGVFQRIPEEVEALQYDGEQDTREYLFKWSQGLVRPTSVDGFPIVLVTFAGVVPIEVGSYVAFRNDSWTVWTADEFESAHALSEASTAK
jgi:hypothetical protein